ncbi:MAG: toxin [Acidobacteria bacterium RIFCSPLOWO2_12_FULL_67_14b]|nr:MAG: toxin [Acidobacteria bacterium RIFCSPLOWO2_12_FULL_67_14b]
MEFIEAPLFTQLLSDFLTDDEYRELQHHLSRDPEASDMIPGTGGFRKLRWADTRRRKGKRGGLRLIYYYFLADWQIWLMTVYDKDSMADLSAAEKRVLKAAIERETRERARRRTERSK